MTFDLEKFLQSSVESANLLTLPEKKALCDTAFALPPEEVFDVTFEYVKPLRVVAKVSLMPEISNIDITLTIPEEA